VNSNICIDTSGVMWVIPGTEQEHNTVSAAAGSRGACMFISLYINIVLYYIYAVCVYIYYLFLKCKKCPYDEYTNKRLIA
jgi:hypothetical protein